MISPGKPLAQVREVGVQRSDAELAMRAKAGDSWAEEAIFRRHARALLKTAGRLLRDPDEAEPTVPELHAQGSRYESPHAPIAPDWFPYNRCDVWACVACGRGFLQYTEFGGYYVDHRLREVDPARVVG